MSDALHTNLLNTSDTYRKLQPFDSVAQLNVNTESVRELYADQMTRSTYRVLDVLHQWSCKYPGVSFRSKKDIAKELGITRKTVTRSCNTLAELGIIVQYETKRHNGDKRQSTNAIVFVPLSPVESKPGKAQVPPECPSVDTPLYPQQPKQLLRNTYQSELSPTLFQRFQSLLSTSIGDTSSASRLYGVYKAQSIRLLRFSIHADKSDLFEALAVQALNITTQASRNKIIRNLSGYYSGVLNALINKTLFADSFKDYGVPVELCTH